MFNHLKVPESWNSYFSKYPNGLTIMEALCDWVGQVDSMVDHINTVDEHINYLNKNLEEFYLTFQDNLSQEIMKTLQAWIEDGTLGEVIAQLIEGRMVFQNIQALQTAPNVFKLGTVVELLGYFTAGDGAGHRRIISDSDDGSGVPVGNKWANVVIENNEVCLNWFGSKADGIFDNSENLERVINYCYSKKLAKLKLPNGKLGITRTIDLTKKMYRFEIEGGGEHSCIYPLKPVNGDSILKLSPYDGSWNWQTSRLIKLNQVHIDGRLFEGQVGIYIKEAQEFMLRDCSVSRCAVGIKLEDSWYGDISGMNVIQDCYIGIEFTKGRTREINTINFNNVKINLSADIADQIKMVPKLSGESDADYKLRVPTVATKIATITGGINFEGCTFEGQDIAVQTRPSGNTPGTNDAILAFTNCYFESIKRKFFSFETASNLENVKYKLTVQGLRAHQTSSLPAEVSTFQGVSLFVRNCQKINAELVAWNSRSSVQYNDSWDIEINSANGNLSGSKNFVSESQNSKFNKYNDVNTAPTNEFYKTRQDDNKQIHISPISAAYHIENHQMNQYTHVPMFFLPNHYEKTGPVVIGDDGSRYMIQVGLDGTVKARKLVIDQHQHVGFKTNKECVESIPSLTDGQLVKSKEYKADLTFTIQTNHKYFTTGTTTKYLKIGKMETYLAKSTLGLSTAGGAHVYIYDYDMRVREENNTYCDPYGNFHNIKCVGTASERPTTVGDVPDFKYFATDEQKCYKWNGVSYVEFAKVV